MTTATITTPSRATRPSTRHNAPLPGPHLRPSTTTQTLTEADLRNAQWLRQSLPEDIYQSMLEGLRPFVTKPAHRFIPGQQYSVCGAKAHKDTMVRASVPANAGLREQCRARGKQICQDCVRLTWVRSDSLARNCSPEQLGQMPLFVPHNQDFLPQKMMRILHNYADSVVPAHLIAIEPCTRQGESVLRLHFDDSPDRDVAYTPVTMLLPHLDALRMIHRPRQVILEGLGAVPGARRRAG